MTSRHRQIYQREPSHPRHFFKTPIKIRDREVLQHMRGDNPIELTIAKSRKVMQTADMIWPKRGINIEGLNLKASPFENQNI
jgi:hypothetical protein